MKTQKYQGISDFLNAFRDAKNQFEFDTGRRAKQVFVSASDLKNFERDLDAEMITRLHRFVSDGTPRLEIMGVRTYAVVDDGVMIAA